MVGLPTTRGLSRPLDDEPPDTFGRIRRGSATGGALRAREIVGMGLVLLAVGIAVYHRHVLDGGFYLDDWADVARTHFSSFQDATGQFWALTSNRPVSVLYLALSFGLLGEHFGVHIASLLILAVATSGALFVVLRMCGMAPVHALLVAALVLVFPYSDTTRLWPTAAQITLAVFFVLVGLALALRGLRATGSAAVWFHAAAVAFYLLGIGSYELAIGLVAASLFVYRFRVPWSRALRRWAVDLTALVIFVVGIRTLTHPTVTRPFLPFRQLVDHARTIGTQTLDLLAAVAVPFTAVPTTVVVSAIALILVVATALRRLELAGPETRRDLRGWTNAALVGAVVTATGYLAIVPADPYYVPLQAGIGNRINAVSAIGFVLLVYSSVVLVGLILFRRPARNALVVAFAALVGAVVFYGFTDRVRDDISTWDRAYAEEGKVLGTIAARLPSMPAGTTLFAVNGRAYAAPGVPIFAATWDLNGAIKLLYNDKTLSAYPVFLPARFVCGATTVYPAGSGFQTPGGPAKSGIFGPYGHVYLFNVGTARSTLVRNRRQCLSSMSTFAPTAP